MRVSVVVPVYASADCLPELVHRVGEACAGRFDDVELILVNDGSPDDSWDVIAELAEGRPWVTGLNLRMNVGQDNALMAGLHHSTGDVVVIMDDDLQHDPADIPALATALEREGADVAYARFERLEQALWKRLGSWFNDRVAVLLLRKPRELYMSPFKAIRRGVVDEICRYDGPFPYVDGLLFTVTSNTTEVSALHHSRFAGTGSYDLWRSVQVWLKLATSFSVIPLRLVSLGGALIAFLAFLVGVYYLVEATLVGRPVEGWLSLMVGVFFLGGIQLLALGTLGEYLGRMLMTVNRRPQYSVKEIRGRSGRTKAATASGRSADAADSGA